MKTFDAIPASEPRTAAACRERLSGRGGNHTSAGIRRRTGTLLGALVTLAVIALPASASAATTSTNETSNYTATAPVVTTHTEETHTTVETHSVETHSETKPESGVKPTGEETSPKSEVKPESAESSPSTTRTEAEKSSLPFTGLNLVWVIGAGLLLLGLGVTLRLAQRRHN